MSVQIVGADGVRRMLQNYTNPKLPRRLQDATKAGGMVMKAPLQAEAGKVSKRMRRGVSVRRAARDRPATVITIRPKAAFFRHWVIRGTADHGAKKGEFLWFIPNWNPYMKSSPPAGASQVKARKVSGMKANPMMARVADRHERQAYDAIDRSLDRTETT